MLQTAIRFLHSLTSLPPTNSEVVGLYQQILRHAKSVTGAEDDNSRRIAAYLALMLTLDGFRLDPESVVKALSSP